MTTIRHDGLLFATVIAPILLGLVALVVLLVGVARAGLGGWWLPVAAGVSVVADEVLPDSAGAWLLALAFLPMGVALAAVGVRLMRGAPEPAEAPAPVPVAV